MKTFCILLLPLAVIFNCIECSSRSERNPGPSSIHAAGKQHTVEGNSTEEHPSRSRSRSPACRSTPIKIFGYSLEELGYIRLIPRTNQNLRFEFRKYIMPAGTIVRWRIDGNSYSSVPAQEHIVLSACNGDFFAILAKSGFLRGIYSNKRCYPRIRMNMISGEIDNLTPEEIRDCPVGKQYPIFPQNFIKAFANDDSLECEWHSNGERNPCSSSARQHLPSVSSVTEESLVRARSLSPPGRPPSHQVLGYPLTELGYVRLIPFTNKNQTFEFRKYVFPTDKPIRMRKNNINYMFGSTQEYIVVSTSDGDVCAILDYSGTLRAIYRSHYRVKINIISSAVNDMTQDEKKDCPVGENRPIFPHSFRKALTDTDSLLLHSNSNHGHNSGSSPSAVQHPPEQTSPQEPPTDARSRSPLGRPPSHEVLGYTLADLGYIRLIPRINTQRQFEFRRYIFFDHSGIHVLSGHGKYVPVPNREHIVLSTSSGDIFAILEYTGLLRGIYETNKAYNYAYSRVRLNMITNDVQYMTAFESKECHIGKNYPIFPLWFNKVVANEDSLKYLYH